ncbi:MAG: alpha-L-fucosidase [Clostridia bacterium]|nr:alpha-L-fucosidase [Clostridia bacterium]
MAFEYIERFKKLGFGLFCHFGLYSVIGRGEWALETCHLDKTEYNKTIEKFEIAKDWAKRLVKTAKEAGCKYITLTTRHHDGFSLYDTCGLNEFDAPHSACGRDLVREFVDECNAEGIIPFFYHTLLDWYNPDYNANFPKYIDYLIQSVEILCKNYGKIGGLWFDGFWNKPHENWQFDRLYATIRKHQPEAMIINNTGLEEQGKVGHPEIDSVTFERGKPLPVDTSQKPIAGEMCEGITDHWGFAAEDLRFKSIPTILETLIDCRKYNCNLLLNVGPTADGTLTVIETEMLKYVGKWISANKEIVYDAIPSTLTADNAVIMEKGDYYYAAIYRVPMFANANVTQANDNKDVKLHTDKSIVDAVWLDNGEPVKLTDGQSFHAEPFAYGRSLHIRVAKFKLK